MADFAICLVAPPEATTIQCLYFHCDMLRVGLLRCGHNVTLLQNSLEHNAMNIIVGSHLLDERSIEQIVSERANAPYVVLQTEVLRNGSFFSSHTSNQRFQERFTVLFERARAIWEFVDEDNLKLIQTDAATALFRGGYDEALADLPVGRGTRYDFCFYGTISRHRRAILDALHARGHEIVAFCSLHRPVRDATIAASRVVLMPRWNEDVDYFAWSRGIYAINNGLTVVAEAAHGDEWLQPVLEDARAEPAQFVDCCERVLATWRERACFQFEQYRQLPSMRERMKEILERTL